MLIRVNNVRSMRVQQVRNTRNKAFLIGAINEQCGGGIHSIQQFGRNLRIRLLEFISQMAVRNQVVRNILADCGIKRSHWLGEARAS